MNRTQFPLWLFPLPLLGQLPQSQLHVAASSHPHYQIPMTKNSCFDVFFRGSWLKTLIIFLKPFFLGAHKRVFHLAMLLPESSDFNLH